MQEMHCTASASCGCDAGDGQVQDVTEASGLDAGSQTLHCGRVADRHVAQVTNCRVILVSLQDAQGSQGATQLPGMLGCQAIMHYPCDD